MKWARTLVVGLMAMLAAFSQSAARAAGAASSASAVGEVDAGQTAPVPEFRLVFERSAAQRGALEELLAAQQDPSSPSYHQWLSPEQFAARFGAAPDQVRAASVWLGRHGFAVGDVARGGGWIYFSGTPEQAARAFPGSHSSFVEIGRATRWSGPDWGGSGPAIPRELEGVAEGMRGLDSRLQPQFPSSQDGTAGRWRPGDFAREYDLLPLYAGGVNGAGVTIAVAGQAQIDVASVKAFLSADGRSVRLQAVAAGTMVGSTTDPADAAEARKALEWAGSVAPGASLLYVSAPNALDAAAYAIDQDIAQVLSVSYGGCESAFSAAEIAEFKDVFEQANAEGMTVVAPAGDAGAAACDGGSSPALQGLAARFPASLPGVTAVGASALAGSAGTGEYAPEIGWSAANGAGGGGSSALFAKPEWQAGNGVPSDGMRDLPDLSFVGNPPFAQAAKDGGAAASEGSVGTTGTAAAFAGVVALLAQKEGGPLGNINPRLYALAASEPQIFHDVSAGTNLVACEAGSKDCGAGGLLGFAASVGYDQATGLGSVDAAALANAFPLGSTATTTTLTSSNVHPSHGQAITLTATLSPSTGPTGTVTFSGPRGTLGAVAVGGGVASLTTNQLPGGNDTVTAAYGGDSTYAPSSGTTQVSVLNEGAGISATVTPASVAPGGSASVVATVTSPSGVDTPTGTVTASFQGASGTFTGTLAPTSTAGTASVTIPVTAPTTAGAYTILVSCSGDTNFTCFTPASVPLAVAKATTTTTLTLSPNPPTPGSPVVLTAAIGTGSASGIAAPTGTVQFLDSGIVINSTGVSNGQATLSTTLAAGKTHSLTAVYSGDSNWASSTSPAVTTNVGTAATATILTVTPNPPVAGSAVVLTAGVTTGSTTGLPVPTGSVQFLDSGVAIGTGNVAVGAGNANNANFSTTLAPGVSHLLTAVYSGDTNWAGSTSPAVSVTEGHVVTTTTLSASSFTVAYGANLTLTATASTTTTGLTTSPTGTMTFSGATQGVLGTAPVTAGTGTASFSSNKLPAGLYTLTASYSGDSIYTSSTSTQNVQVTVGAATATITASASPSSNVMYGTVATVTATVQGSGATTPTGTVTVTVPGVSGVYTGTLVPNPGPGGSATINIPVAAPPPGTYALQVVYGGDTTYTSVSTTTSLTTIKGNTVTTVTASPNPSILNVATTLTATVAPAGAATGTVPPSGTVQFLDGGTALGSPVALANGVATTTATFTVSGPHSIVAVYSGDANWNTSTSSVFTLAVTAAPTTTVLSTNFANNTALAGANIIFTVTVAPQTSSTITGITSVPTGTVTFYDSYNNSFTTLGSGTLQQNGLASSAATFQTKFFLGGTHVITAVYSGDKNFLTSTAATIHLTIQDFIYVAVPSTLVLTKGSSAQVPIVVTPVAGFTGSVAFGCLPPLNTETTCSITPTQITGGGGTVSLLLNTTAAHSQATHQSENRGGRRPGGFALPATSAALAGLLLLLVPRSGARGRRRLPSVWVLALVTGLAAMAGCSTGPTTTAGNGKGGGGTLTDPGTPQGTIAFVITAVGTDGQTSVAHQMTYQVTVQ